MAEIRLSDHFGYKRLIRFTLPTIASMLFMSVYFIVDGFFISNIVGSTAFASVNLIVPVTMILSTFGFMVGSGGSALVSKTLGEGKEQEAREYFSMLIYFLLIVGIIFAIVGNIFLRPLAQLLGASDEMLDDCVAYGSILLISLPAFMLQIAFQNFMVTAERPRMGLAVSIGSGIANMVMDFLFVYAFRWGIRGAALASASAQVVGAVVPLIFFLRKNDTRLRLVLTGFNFHAILRSCINGASEMVTNLSLNLVNILYNYQLMRMVGSDGVVAYGIIMYVSFIFNGVYMGYASGSAPIVSYQYGAENKKEIHNLLQRSLRLIFITSVIMTFLSELLAGIQAGIFVSYDNDLLAFATNAVRLYTISYLISGINLYSSSFFTALNNGFVSALISFLRTFVFIIAAVLILPVLLGINGIWLAIVAAELLSLAVSMTSLKVNQKRYGY